MRAITGALALGAALLGPLALAPARADDEAEQSFEEEDALLALAERVQRLMHDGLEHELFGRYDQAKAHYEEATAADPKDPVPLRFLGELYRHHIARWDLARECFEKILALTEDGSDPFSRAIALHGIGKMTIFGGDYEGGVKLIEKSVEAHPTQLAYRNLAVFWNSEAEFDKAWGYVNEALALAPKDPYTRVFHATYLAQRGRGKEALAVIDEVPIDPSMYYNVAAIHSELGQTEKALEYLRRHFYEFESNDAVRWYEMQEARSDYALRKLHEHPEFIKMTTAPLATPEGAPAEGPPTWAESPAAKRMAERAKKASEGK